MSLTIWINDVDFEKKEIEINMETRVKDVIENNLKMDSRNCHLLFEGDTLDVDKKVFDYGIVCDSELSLEN